MILKTMNQTVSVKLTRYNENFIIYFIWCIVP